MLVKTVVHLTDKLQKNLINQLQKSLINQKAANHLTNLIKSSLIKSFLKKKKLKIVVPKSDVKKPKFLN